jgi:hypothetical protein
MKFFDFLRIPALFSIILLAFVFVGCKDDDDDDKTPVDNNEIVGKWQLTSITPETAGTLNEIALLPTLAPCIYTLKFTFTDNNKVALSECDPAVALIGSFIKIESATEWKVETGKLTIKNGSTSNTFGLVQNPNDMQIIVNTNTTGTGAPVNAILSLKRL